MPTNDIVWVASGSLVQVEAWRELLQTAGVPSRIVGDNLTAGLGTVLPGSIELWVSQVDAKFAEATIAGAGGYRSQEPQTHLAAMHGHPVDDPKPDRSRGPQHGAPPHRPLPSL